MTDFDKWGNATREMIEAWAEDQPRTLWDAYREGYQSGLHDAAASIGDKAIEVMSKAAAMRSDNGEWLPGALGCR